MGGVDFTSDAYAAAAMLVDVLEKIVFGK
jgi:hypothetical protein